MAYWNLFPSQTPFSPTKQPLGVIFPGYRKLKGWNLSVTFVIPVSVHRIDLPGSGSDHYIKIVPTAFDLHFQPG